MLVPLGTVTALMVIMVTKHFVADFLAQTDAIAKGKAADTGWLAPLILHASGHAVITLLIAVVAYPRVWWIATLELLLHAGIDRAKVLIGKRAHLDMGKAEYWWLLGFDQFLHHLTNVAIIAIFLAFGS